MNHRSRALLDLACDQTCQHCGARDGTIVAAHSNHQEHGKGKSIKAHDCLHAWLCGRCHDFYDGRSNIDPVGLFRPLRADRREMFMRAFTRTMVELWAKGLIRVA